MNFLIIVLFSVQLVYLSQCTTDESDIQGNCQRWKQEGCLLFGTPLVNFEGSVEWTGDSAENKLNQTLQFCNEPTCSSPINKAKLYLKQKFWILQKVTTPGLSNIQIKYRQVYYRVAGIIKRFTPLSVDNSKKGQLILEYIVPFVCDVEINIEVISKFLYDFRGQQYSNQLNQLQIVSRAIATFNPSLEDGTTCTATGECIVEAFLPPQLCNEPTCASSTVFIPKYELYLNEMFFLLQTITPSGFTRFKDQLKEKGVHCYTYSWLSDHVNESILLFALALFI